MAMQSLKLREIFVEALRRVDPSERASFLDSECPDSAARQRIEELLRAHEDPMSVLDELSKEKAPESDLQTKTLGSGSNSSRPSVPLFALETSGAVVAGRYRLLEEVGEGGMGTVWAAEQTQPVRRRVALKLVKAGMDSRTVLARFSAERQALAMMDHPNIAKVLDGGLTESGRPFFAMEYVKGIPITDYCDGARLTIPQRLSLFLQVCSAVQHAHQKGIIHRDLKPSNILVGSSNDEPLPKVIDFGLAKAMHQPLTEKTLHTARETVLGTPLYMSPEQAQFNNLDVDTRSDVYSLGVLLYELLAGTLPFERARFKEMAWDETLRIIREEEPPRPSARLSATSSLPSLASSRQMEPLSLRKALRGELDWIVMKSLEKDRTRRYETANALARDLQRYLADEVVEARPPTAGYRMRKFVRRHKGQVLAAASVLLALFVGICGTTFGLIRAEDQRSIAERARADEQLRAESEREAKLDADQKRAEAESLRKRSEAGEKLASERLALVEVEQKKAEEEKTVAQAVRDFLRNKLLGQADAAAQANALLSLGEPSTGAKLNPTIRELLDRAALELAPDKIEGNFPNQPRLQAELLETIGTTYRGIGEFGKAIAFLTRAVEERKKRLGENDPSTLKTLGLLAGAYQSAGQRPRSSELFKQVAESLEKVLGPEHPDTLDALGDLAAANIIARKFPKAIELLERVRNARKDQPDDRKSLANLRNLAAAYRGSGKNASAIELLEQIAAREMKTLGVDHPDSLATRNDLAVAYREAGDWGKAISLLERVRDAEIAKLGAEHPQTLETLHDLAQAYFSSGQLSRAIPLFESVRESRERVLGDQHPLTLLTLTRLALAYQADGNLRKAIDILEGVRETRVKKNGIDHPNTLGTFRSLAKAYQAIGDYPRAIELFEVVRDVRIKKLGERDQSTIESVAELASAYVAAGDFKKAIPLLDRAAAELEKREYRRELVGKIALDAARAYEGMKRFDIAERFRRKRLAIAEEADGLNSPAFANELASLGYNLLQQKKYSDAEVLLRECFESRTKLEEKKLVPLWQLARAKSLLGEALLGQGKLSEAESLLKSAYSILKESESAIPAAYRSDFMVRAIDRLIDLAEAEKDPESAMSWKDLRAKYRPLAPMPREKH